MYDIYPNRGGWRKRIEVDSECIEVILERFEVSGKRCEVGKRFEVDEKRIEESGKCVEVWCECIEVYSNRIEVSSKRCEVYLSAY